MCSTRWDRPASSSDSATEPVPIQNPRATDRTESMCSVTIRTPESSSVRRCCSCTAGVLVAIASAAMAGPAGAGAAAAAAAAAVSPRAGAAAVAVTPRAAVAAAPAAAGADASQLLDGLAGDLGVLGEAQADAATLAVDLDHADGDLVALVEDVLDVLDALTGLDVADVQQAVGALGQLDEGAERGRLDDLGGRELVPDLDVLEHLLDVGAQLLAQLAVGRVDQDLTLVVDVDLGLELVGEATDRLAALTDQHADLGRVDLDLDDPRGELRQLGT